MKEKVYKEGDYFHGEGGDKYVCTKITPIYDENKNLERYDYTFTFTVTTVSQVQINKEGPR